MLPAAQDEAPQNRKAFGSHRTPEAFFITAPDLWMSDDGAAQKTTAPKARSPSPHFTKEEKKMTENNRLRLAMQKSGDFPTTRRTFLNAAVSRYASTPSASWP